MLTPEAIEQLENLMISMAQPNIDLMVKTLLDMGITDNEIDVKEFKADLVDSLGPYYNAKLGQINFATVFDVAFTLGRKYKLKLPLNFILLAKSLTTMEGLGKKYLPEFNFEEYVKPKAKELIKRRMSPLYVLSNVKQGAGDLAELVRNFPGEFSRLVRALKYGTKVNVDIDNKDVRELTDEIDRSSNRLTFGMIIAALIIATAVIVLSKVGPFIWGIPVLAHICIILIFIFTISLIYSMLKERGGDY
jgi:ubiquinone biosynthesis protein